MKKAIPNIITLGNLLCGALATIFVLMDGNFLIPALLVLAGAVLDFLDGFVARSLKVKSEVGKHLDSLADVVTFGLVPGLIGFQLLRLHSNFAPDFPNFLIIMPLGITLFSALRLARFNVDKKQKDQFLGLPTPANALFWIAVPFPFLHKVYWETAFVAPENPFNDSYLLHIFLPLIAVICCFLLVSEIPMIAFKFKHFRWKENEARYIFVMLAIIIVLAAVLLTENYFLPLLLIVPLYILISLVYHLMIKNE